jgi:hypothetical protein
MRRLVLLVAVVSAAAAVLAATASADYGRGAQYQVEISSNPGGIGFWIWAELGPEQTSDYQETDCIHLGGGHANDAAAHDAGSLQGWGVNNGVLTMTGMKLIGGAALATVQVAAGYGHSNWVTFTVTWEAEPFFPLNTPITFPSQVQVAP